MSHEIYENDNVVYLEGTPVPWHNLAKVLPPNLTSAESMHHAGLGWEVKKIPVFRQEDSFIESAKGFSDIENYAGLLRIDTNQILDIVSDSYSPFQNREAFELFQNVIDTGLVRINTAGSLKNGRIVWVLGEILGAEEEVTAGDLVKRYVLYSWGHMSGRSLKLGYTTERVVCNNTLTAAERDGTFIRILHKGNVVENAKLVTKALDVVTSSFKADVALFKQMLNTHINQDDLIQYVKVSLNMEEKSTKSKNIISKVVGLASAGTGNEELGNTLWGAFNGVTEFVSHFNSRNPDSRTFNKWWGSGKSIIDRALDKAREIMAT